LKEEQGEKEEEEEEEGFEGVPFLWIWLLP